MSIGDAAEMLPAKMATMQRDPQDTRSIDRAVEIKQLEEKAKALQAKAQELNQQVQQINIEYIKVIGAIEYLKGLKDEA